MTPDLSHEEAEVVSALIAGAIMRRFAAALRSDGAQDEGAIDALSMLVGCIAIPVLETMMTESEPLRALDEQEALERML